MQRGHHCHKSFQNLLDFPITFCIAHPTIHSIPKVFFFFPNSKCFTPGTLHRTLPCSTHSIFLCSNTPPEQIFSTWNPQGPHHQLLSTFLYSPLIVPISKPVSLIFFFFEVTGNMHNLFINQFCGCSFFFFSNVVQFWF